MPEVLNLILFESFQNQKHAQNFSTIWYIYQRNLSTREFPALPHVPM